MLYLAFIYTKKGNGCGDHQKAGHLAMVAATKLKIVDDEMPLGYVPDGMRPVACRGASDSRYFQLEHDNSKQG